MTTRICIYGAGAIGGYLGARLALAGLDGVETALVARGPHLAAMRANGLTLEQGGETRTAPVTATDDPAQLGPQDYVIVTLKAHSVPAAVPAMQPLLGPDTAVVFAVNGLPWWYFHGLDGRHAGTRLATVDPGNVQWDGIGPERAIGCVVYTAAEVSAPGVIRHIDLDRFSLGEPSGERSARVQRLSKILIAAGVSAPVRPRIRDEMWIKLWGNCSLNPISALTGATIEQMCRDPDVRAVLRAVMLEAQAVGESLGVRFAIDVDKRIAGAQAVGAHRTSMLQDLERGRPMEIDALVGAVAEVARLTGTPTPTLDTVLALVKQRARLAGCYA
ncbi:MAG: 2-dehydropantoate 2-reductase [Hyphomicrobiales bacterium]|nr:2-dehydropantoate 2-reductase [Hyphomicrobiales bacterium]